MSVARGLLLVLCLLPAACHATRFASAPAGVASDCDPAWVGHWQVAQARDGGGMHDAGRLEVPAGCLPLRLREAEHAPEAIDDYRVRFVHSGALRLLAVTPAQPAEPGVMLFRYEAGAGRIAVFEVDHPRVARRILDGTLSGRSVADNQVREGQAQAHPDSVDTLVADDGPGVAALLQADPRLFQPRPWLVLTRTEDAP